MTVRIEGESEAESAAILDELYEIGERREFIFERAWKLGDFLMWDNRCTIHARTDSPNGEPRLLRRCTVEGEPLHELTGSETAMPSAPFPVFEKFIGDLRAIWGAEADHQRRM